MTRNAYHSAHHWTALIIDDEAENLAVASADLTQAGITTYVAQTGKHGLALLTATQPTFVLLDLNMPSMTGWEVVQAIRRNHAVRHTPVIALTNLAVRDNPLPGFAEKLTGGGFDGYIGKPFNIGELLEQIKAVMVHCDQRC
jgi:CheY-like chemotaxis protein